MKHSEFNAHKKLVSSVTKPKRALSHKDKAKIARRIAAKMARRERTF